MFARTPIFRTDQRVFGYEIQLHPDPGAPEADPATLLLDWAKEYPFESFAGARLLLPVSLEQVPALLAAPELEALRRRRPLLGWCEASPQLVELQRLRTAGFGLLLDASATVERDELLALAELLCACPGSAATLASARLPELARNGRLLLARAVATREAQQQSAALGFTLFQGEYFWIPTVDQAAELPRSKVNHLQFLAELERPELDLAKVEQVIKREPALVLRLMRYLNSPLFGARNPITSVRQALVHLGEQPLRRWGRVLVLTGLGEDRPDELVATSLLRARACELLGQRADKARSEAYFLTGLLSLVDVMLGQPLVKCLQELPIDGAIRRAILGEDNPFGRALKTVVALERADWQRLEGSTLESPTKLYCEALRWTAQTLSAGAA